MKKKSSSCFLFILPTLLVVISLFHSVHADTLEDNCKKIAGPNVPKDFCITNLGADPASKTADMYGLGVISLKMTSENATALKTKIEKLAKDPGTKKEMKFGLMDCMEAYGDVVYQANDALEKLKARRIFETRTALISVARSTDDCLNGISGLGIEPSLSNDIDYFKKMATIPLSIYNILQKPMNTHRKFALLSVGVHK